MQQDPELCSLKKYRGNPTFKGFLCTLTPYEWLLALAPFIFTLKVPEHPAGEDATTKIDSVTCSSFQPS